MSRAARVPAEHDAPPGAADWIRSALATEVQSLTPLAGGAGRRRYWRATCAGGRSAVLMHALPEDPAILPPALRRPRARIPFVEVTGTLARRGVPVPEVYAVDAARLWVLVEDLGDLRLCDLPAAERERRNAEAIELLARVHGIQLDPEADALVLERSFDVEWIGFELRLFLDGVADRGLRSELAPALEALAADIASLDRHPSLRDFQSQNLMIDARGRLRVLDYQDALLAPPELDLAAFLFDSYVDVARDERLRLLERYGRRAPQVPSPGSLALLVVQRKCKDFSRFQSLVHVKGDVRFAGFEAAARTAVLGALPDLPAEHAPLRTLLPRAMESPQ